MLRIRKLFASLKFRICFIFFAVFIFWLLVRVIHNNINQKNVHFSHVQNPENSLMKNQETAGTYYLPVGVYYEALCPDSRNFILQHLVPSIDKAPNSFDVDFVPYGKAQTRVHPDGFIIFDCQHGEVECQANRIHSCAKQHIKDKSILVKYIACMIDNNYDPERIGIDCAKRYSINWNTIYICSKGKEGEQLLKQNGEATDKLWPEVSFIPTITINQEQPRQASVLKDFWAVACSYFPPESKPIAC